VRVGFSLIRAAYQARSPRAWGARRTAGGRYQGPSCFNPHGLAFSAARGGRLWVSDPDNGALFLFDTTRDGAFVRAVKDASLFTAPRGITLLPPAPSAGFRGALVVAEARRVVMLSLTGQRLFHALRLVGAVNILGLSVNSARREVYAADPAAKAVFVIAYDEVALNALHLRHEQGSVEERAEVSSCEQRCRVVNDRNDAASVK